MFKKVLMVLALGVISNLSSALSLRAQALTCVDSKVSCEGSIGVFAIQTPISDWSELTVGDGKGKGGLILKFLPDALILGNLRVSKGNISLIRRFNRSNFSSTRNGVPRKFVITYQLYVVDTDGTKGVFFDVLDFNTMRQLDMQLSTWHPGLPILNNEAWTR